MKAALLPACLMLVSTSSFAKTKEDPYAAYLAMTPEQVQAKVELTDDPLDVGARLQTSNVYTPEMRGDGTVEDEFLRVAINRKTGESLFVVYGTVYYNGDWRYYSSAAYDAPDGPGSAELRILRRKVNNCSAYRRSCSFSEIFTFTVDESLLRKIATTYSPVGNKEWRLKFRADQAEDLQQSISVAEVAGLLLAVDAYRREHNLIRTQSATAQHPSQP